MPAPNRRNKGESLAHHIDTEARARQVANDRDNLVAARTRKDARWEAAAAALDRPKSDLAERAERARADYERGLHFDRYERAVRAGKAKPPIAVVTPEAPPRYLLVCIDCSATIWLHRPEPRRPLCPQCADRRVKRKASR